MSFKIVVDSCCDLPAEARKDPVFEIVPLFLEIGDYSIMDDEQFDQLDFIARVAQSESPARTACPSPDRYKQAYEADADDVYVVTLSSPLSASYNSAILGKSLYEEEHGDGKNIHVVDSWSACCGEANIALAIKAWAESGLSFEEVVEKAEAMKREMRTYFVLDNLDTLRKNGRLTGLKSIVASTLSVKPVMSATEGVIIQRSQAIGTKKALVKMVDIIAKETARVEEKVMMITHVNCYERAMTVRDMILAKCSFRNAIVVDAAGVATVYAGDGGIVVAC